MFTKNPLTSHTPFQFKEQVQFENSSLGKAFEKGTEKQVALDLPSEKDQLKETEGIFPQNLINYSIRAKLKEIVKLQGIIKKDVLNYQSKRWKIYNFGKCSLPIAYLRYIHEGYL